MIASGKTKENVVFNPQEVPLHPTRAGLRKEVLLDLSRGGGTLLSWRKTPKTMGDGHLPGHMGLPPSVQGGPQTAGPAFLEEGTHQQGSAPPPVKPSRYGKVDREFEK